VKANGARILPLEYGLNVNSPYITSQVDASCVNPPFIQSRMTGGAYSYVRTTSPFPHVREMDRSNERKIQGVKFSATIGLFKNLLVNNTLALNVCINGDCSLPGEASFLDKDCKTSVSVFTVDYDASDSSSCAAGSQTAAIRSALGPLVQYANSTSLVGGLNGTTSVFGNSTATKTRSTMGSATSAVFTGAAVVPALSYCWVQ
jgi:5'-nucleotidase